MLDVAVLYPPVRAAPVNVARALVNAVAAEEEVEIDYVSLSSGVSRRRIAPHAFAHDGMRFHVRAFDHKRGQFVDFVMGRIETVHGHRRGTIDLDSDTDWFEIVNIELVPNPSLSADQRRIVMAEYTFDRPVLTHRVRRSMLLYTNFH